MVRGERHCAALSFTAMLGLFLLAFAHVPGAAADSGDVLHSYLTDSKLITTRGFWYNIVTWAARTHNCDNYPESVACMACCMNLPQFAWDAGVAPLGVGNSLWFNPERGATCGMCLRVYMPQGKSGCSDAIKDSDPSCGGTGNMPYYPNVDQPWAYGAHIDYDSDLKMHYFTGMVVEWFDRNQSLPTAITYPTEGKSTDNFGSWPVLWRAVPCPVNGHKMTYNFLNTSGVVPTLVTGQTGWTDSAPSSGALPSGVSGSLCDNEFSQPCAALTKPGQLAPMAYVKLMIAGTRRTLKRSGDNYWELDNWYSPTQDLPQPTDPYTPINFKVQCEPGAAFLEQDGVVPASCMCTYQNPLCKPCISTIQC